MRFIQMESTSSSPLPRQWTKSDLR